MGWYSNELLALAEDLGKRLLPAFNTSTGIPYPRVNLRHGLKQLDRTEQATCTACAGSMILEFAALSRMTGDPIYEQKANHALNALWDKRNVASNLMGTVINVHNGDWLRRGMLIMRVGEGDKQGNHSLWSELESAALRVDYAS